MNIKKSIRKYLSLTLALVLTVLSANSPVNEVQATGGTQTAPTAPDGYTLEYIGRYSQVVNVSDGMIAVSDGESFWGKWGFVDANTGKEVIAPKYEVLSKHKNGITENLRYHEDRLILNSEDGVQVIDKTGKVIVPLGRYTDISFYENGVAAAFDGKRYHLIDKSGKEIFTSTERIYITYDPTPHWSDGLVHVSMLDADLKTSKSSVVSDGIIDITGKSIMPFSKDPRYSIRKNGVIEVKTYTNPRYTYYVDKDGKKVEDTGSAWIDRSTTHTPKYSDIMTSRFYKEIYGDEDEEKEKEKEGAPSNWHSTDKVLGKYNYFDSATTEAIDEQFDFLTAPEDGVAIVGKFVEWKYLSIQRFKVKDEETGQEWFLNKPEYRFSRPLCDWYILKPIK